MKPIVSVLYTPGTNSHVETMRAFRAVGAQPELLFTEDLAAGKASLDDGDMISIPGGFAFGDHLGAGRVAGQLFGEQLRDALAKRPRPVIAICNGFQIAVRCGLFGPGVDLKPNTSGVFCNRPNQVHRVVTDNQSIWLTGLHGEEFTFPCAHAEGQFRFDTTIPVEQRRWQTALTYPKGTNPDGSQDDIAGITTRDGLIIGMMDHPERTMDLETRHVFFENGVKALL